MKKEFITGVLILIVLLVGSFTAGACYQKLKTIDRDQEVLQSNKNLYDADDVKYIATGIK